MDWYKLALKQNELYELYSLQGLPDESLVEQPGFLHDLISLTNQLREEILKDLPIIVANELRHGAPPAMMQALDNQILTNSHWRKLGDSFWEDIKAIFRNPDLWDRNYGGEKWALITEWLQRIINTQPLTYPQRPSNEFLQKLRELVFIIDTIYSLSHNTNLALSKKYRWLPLILEIVKNAEEPAQLAQLIGDIDLLKQYRELDFRSHRRKDLEQAYYDALYSLDTSAIRTYILYALEQEDFTLFKALLKYTKKQIKTTYIFHYPHIVNAIMLADSRFQDYFQQWMQEQQEGKKYAFDPYEYGAGISFVIMRINNMISEYERMIKHYPQWGPEKQSTKHLIHREGEILAELEEWQQVYKNIAQIMDTDNYITESLQGSIDSAKERYKELIRVRRQYTQMS